MVSISVGSIIRQDAIFYLTVIILKHFKEPLSKITASEF